MNQLLKIPALAQLHKLKLIDKKSNKMLSELIENSNKVLVIASKASGKNTLQNSIVTNFLNRQKDPLVIPPTTGISLASISSNSKLKSLKSMIKDYKCYITSIEYRNNVNSNIEELVKLFLKEFDLIIDLRKIEKDRTICNIITGNVRLNYIYTNPSYDF